jgi:hypothetical protein
MVSEGQIEGTIGPAYLLEVGGMEVADVDVMKDV